MSYDFEEPQRCEVGPKATFSIRVESFDTSTFYEDVVRGAVDRIVGPRYPESALVKKINEAAAALVEQKINDTISTAIDDLIAKPIQKYDTFGNPVGLPISVEEIVRVGADKFLTEIVDSEGRSTTSSFGMKYTRLEWLVHRAVVNDLAKEMKEEVYKVRGELLKRASEAAAAVLAGTRL